MNDHTAFASRFIGIFRLKLLSKNCSDVTQQHTGGCALGWKYCLYCSAALSGQKFSARITNNNLENS
jgi:hypothetical protein